MPIERKCAGCGKTFSCLLSEDKKHKRPRRFCSRRCGYDNPTFKSTEERLKKHSKPGRNGCILYVTNAGNPYPYHAMKLPSGKSERAYRVAFELYKHPIPKGLHCCHKCDNPACINPEHLFLSTNKGNVLDKMRKGRQLRGEQIGNSKLKKEQVLEIAKLLGGGISQGIIAAKYNVSRSCIEFIGQRKRWKHLWK